MKFFTPLLAILIQYYPQTYMISGILSKVYDGDTIMLAQSNNTQRKIRLVYIDAAESDQGEWGMKPKKYLEQFLNKKVEVKIVGKGFYKRLLGEVFYHQRSLNFELLEKAWVWLYPWSRFESLEQKHLFIETQEHNKINKRGVWGSRILKPWKYRKKRRRGKI